ncbi:DUF3179 domain-containing (seleno)protein, partial [Halobium palmae]
MPGNNPNADDERIDALVDRLLRRDADAHENALRELATAGDERIVPHLVELLVIDSIANDWERFGFPEVLRERAPPRYLDLPETSWPGVGDALRAVAEPSFDSEYAWVEWESWYSQQEIEPLDGFDEWKLRLYRSFLPPVGRLLDAEPRSFDLQEVRWGNCDPSFLAALNEPEFVRGDAVTVDVAANDVDGAGEADAGEGESGGEDGSGGEGTHGSDGNPERYLKETDRVFGFEIGGRAYVVPRWVIFPHEMLNVTLDGTPLSLTYCTLCNAPILYDSRVDGDRLTLGSTGMLISGNKVMFDEETDTLWSQHRGVPIAGPRYDPDDDLALDVVPVTQSSWGEWREEHPDSLALDLDTGFDYDYRFYDGDLGIFRHYWENDDVVQPGVRSEESDLPEKAEVYGVTGDDPDAVTVFPAEALAEAASGALVDELDVRRVG